METAGGEIRGLFIGFINEKWFFSLLNGFGGDGCVW